jgi:hypothetical protein
MAVAVGERLCSPGAALVSGHVGPVEIPREVDSIGDSVGEDTGDTAAVPVAAPGVHRSSMDMRGYSPAGIEEPEVVVVVQSAAAAAAAAARRAVLQDYSKP